MGKEIIVAVVDTGIDYGKTRASVRDNLYVNRGERPGNGRDDDRNGFVDDVTGPSTGPASNHHYQPQTSGHGMGMVSSVSGRIDAAEEIAGGPLPVSIMPVSMEWGAYYANIVKAAKAGASVISLSHNLSYDQKAYVSRILEPYDVIAVTVDRDRPGNANPDAGDIGRTSYDNVIEVALVSDRIVKGNGPVDLLEIGSSLANTSESHAIAKVAGKIGAIWSVDPSRSAAEVLDIVAASTSRDHRTIREQGLHSEMGGQIDLCRAIEIAQGRNAPGNPDPRPEPDPEPRPDPAPKPKPNPEPDPITGPDPDPTDRKPLVAAGYTLGSADDEEFVFRSDRGTAIGNGGKDLFTIETLASREHAIRDFDSDDVIDMSGLVSYSAGLDRPDDHVRIEEVSWNGATHTRVLVAQGGGGFEQAVILIGVEGLSLGEMIASDALML